MEDGASLAASGDERDAMSVAAASAVLVDQRAVVRGYVVVSGGVATISDLLAESYPPQPGGAWMRIRNPEHLDLPDTYHFEDTTWTTRAAVVIGHRIDDEFELDPPDQAADPGRAD